ncbi:MAG: hypothetical protein ABI589_08425, partial [Burkholderiales bacterium]
GHDLFSGQHDVCFLIEIDADERKFYLLWTLDGLSPPVMLQCSMKRIIGFSPGGARGSAAAWAI